MNKKKLKIFCVGTVFLLFLGASVPISTVVAIQIESDENNGCPCDNNQQTNTFPDPIDIFIGSGNGPSGDPADWASNNWEEWYQGYNNGADHTDYGFSPEFWQCLTNAFDDFDACIDSWFDNIPWWVGLLPNYFSVINIAAGIYCINQLINDIVECYEWCIFDPDCTPPS